jgi:hypothetical protein
MTVTTTERLLGKAGVSPIAAMNLLVANSRRIQRQRESERERLVCGHFGVPA